ncbi:3-isopropylmalate dehydratase large subunit [Streptomyces samsunensis]|uniref:3-isopropylmalate dehydratase large subunit n=1 Tax=Streptomyces malaysiensis TaxID=92644 RepID=A0ABX6WE82_STRMQ|nr:MULTISPECIES: 3-isopropylmalate dehydratase large subunit [Streptomyces]MCQ6248128.1 3-isopropylmalate dehydratase large subunit [Streptomyces malaysiensis]NUH37629.1 3-isopropylmalate dehydratase large subunit [Streptomyces samsunensis]QPI59707.1 3-isopropylmalate dehydratase large subunit [Streptomyces solisilvae]UHH21376.1 3-isopropylmalate dehydratase large subunit [Streptomyces sp. HNM0561]
MSRPTTLIDKVWDAHVVHHQDGADLLYVDLHLIHEATSAQAFDGLGLAGRRVRRPDLTLAVEDHNVPTDSLTIGDPVASLQVRTLRRNCAEHGIRLFSHGDARQGVVHVVGPELGLVLPGMTVTCGDSHTSTHGAFGALAFGVGTSDVEHVLATQSVALRRPRTMAVEFTGPAPDDVTAKDLALALLARLGANGAHGHVLEYLGDAVRALSIEGRMTLCNMSVEAGARAGLVAPDETTLAYLRQRPESPRGTDWEQAAAYWSQLRTDAGAVFDRTVRIDASALTPHVTWGTNPGQAVGIGDRVPDPEQFTGAAEQAAARRALEYMALAPGTAMRDIRVDTVFIGSCTNGRLEDLRAAADVLRGRAVAPGVRMLVVPGSTQVRRAAEAEGLDEVFLAAGAQWRFSGCSMCLGMNPDRLPGTQRCASTSNRNYEGRQGNTARTHLVSPAMAAATAVTGRFTTPADLD